MNKSISLWRRKATISSDEACTTITSYNLPRYVSGPYESPLLLKGSTPLTYVPSLQSLCLRQLVAYPEQVYKLDSHSLSYEPPSSPEEYDILRELIPDYSYTHTSHGQSRAFLKQIDPRLWAVLVQVYSGLPEVFRTYTLPLSDIYLPLLQQIPSTPRFSLVTVLHLRSCNEVDDNTIIELRDLHGLTALDVGATALSSWGVSKLSKTLRRASNEDGDSSRTLLGPWELRILCLRDCLNVNNDVYNSLRAFPLLSVVDLRGTRCTPSSYKSSAFRPSTDTDLYHPTPLQDTLASLSQLVTSTLSDPTPHTSSLFSNPNPFYLHINALTHQPTPTIRVPPPSIGILDKSRNWPPRPSRDIFMSENLDSRSWTVPSEVQSEADIVAATEARRLAARAAALAFYSHQSRMPRGFADLPPDSNVVARERSKPLTGLTLFRPPPPWSLLQTIAHDNADICARSMSNDRTKRPRIEIDEALMGATEAKRKGEALSAVRAIWSMVERRKSAPELGGANSKSTAVDVSGNPFLRKMEKSAFDEDSEMDEIDEPSSGTLGGRRVGGPSAVDDSSLEAVQKSTFPLLPPTTKSLRPISTLFVPDRPAETPKGKGAQASLPKGSRSVDNSRQMKISVFTEEAAHKSKKTIQGAGESMKVFEGNSVGSAKAAKDVEHASTSRTESGRVVHGKRKKRESGFDWKGWSTR